MKQRKKELLMTLLNKLEINTSDTLDYFFIERPYLMQDEITKPKRGKEELFKEEKYLLQQIMNLIHDLI